MSSDLEIKVDIYPDPNFFRASKTLTVSVKAQDVRKQGKECWDVTEKWESILTRVLLWKLLVSVDTSRKDAVDFNRPANNDNGCAHPAGCGHVIKRRWEKR